MQLMSGDQSGPVVELDGSLLSEIHIPFKVALTVMRVSFESKLKVSFLPPARHAFACARVPQRQLHLRVGVSAALPLYALGAIHPCLSNPWVSLSHNSCFHFHSCVKKTLNSLSSHLTAGKITTST